MMTTRRVYTALNAPRFSIDFSRVNPYTLRGIEKHKVHYIKLASAGHSDAENNKKNRCDGRDIQPDSLRASAEC